MLERADHAYLCAKIRGEKFVERLLHEEKGASDIVAIMVIIVILLAVAMIFKDRLEQLVGKVFDKAGAWVDNPT